MSLVGNVSDVDQKCAEACTRSGITILILALISITLMVPLEKGKNLEQLSRYLLLRDNLSDSIEELELNQCWISIKNSEYGEAAENEWTIATLNYYRCTSPPSKVTGKPKPGTADTEPESPAGNFVERSVRNLPADLLIQTKKQLDQITSHHEVGSGFRNFVERSVVLVPPSAPTDIHLEFGLQSAFDIADTLNKLVDRDLIEGARKSNYTYDRLVYRWIVYANQLSRDNQGIYLASNGLLVPYNPVAYLKSKREFIPPSDEDYLWKTLPLRDVKLLSKYKAPDAKDVIALLSDVSKVNLPIANQQFTLLKTAIALQLLMLVCMGYFWLFQQEARVAASYPARGTIFGAFSRTRTTRILYILLVSFAPLSSIALSISAWKETHIILWCSLMLVVASIIILKTSGFLRWHQKAQK